MPSVGFPFVRIGSLQPDVPYDFASSRQRLSCSTVVHSITSCSCSIAGTLPVSGARVQVGQQAFSQPAGQLQTQRAHARSLRDGIAWYRMPVKTPAGAQAHGAFRVHPRDNTWMSA